eukprot:gnl/TRDRNA2_/TRDRNA2_166312_c2_seq1.p1 gnl/TRDRNA2_/TRDRNA2_166312_c2~~gnl/TRDRNA2_/TRDRNA2_166312_c2_seq1.p1  ORF type:complete len:311 (-),score=44.70 gnl/TRDRNA2_/TRDRNA2_166312_c2_seq1:102-1034(-)
MPSEETPCELDTCEVDSAEDVPDKIRTRDESEYEFDLDGWTRKDMPSDFTEYFDLRDNPEGNTGYDGKRIWRFIHQKICFRRDLQNTDAGWKRDFNRAISGMHSAVHTHILSEIGFNEEGLVQYRRRIRDEPGATANLYFAYMVTLCAIHDLRARLTNCSYLGEGPSILPVMTALVDSELLNGDAIQRAGANLRKHAQSDAVAGFKARLRSRDLYAIMNCVQCNLCRMHGKVMAIGLGAAMQVLLGKDGRGDNPSALQRMELAALVVTASKFGIACTVLEQFRKLDGDDKPFVLGGATNTRLVSPDAGGA